MTKTSVSSDKNVPLQKHVFVQRDLQERVIYKNDSRFEAIRLFHLIYYMTKKETFKLGSSL